MEALRLITFPPSADTETARWILAHHRALYREVPQSAVGSALAAARRLTKIPILLTTAGKFSGSRQIADHLDAQSPSERRLIPDDAAMAVEINRLWAEYNGGMVAWIAQWAYFYVFQDRDLTLRMTTFGVPRWQRYLDRRLRPVFVWVMRQGLGNRTRSVAVDALGRCHRKFDEVDERMRDGRPYLLGDRFTLADVAFCACAGPLMLASDYGGPLPQLVDVPEEMRREVLGFRERAAGRYALRTYATHYRPFRTRRSEA